MRRGLLVLVLVFLVPSMSAWGHGEPMSQAQGEATVESSLALTDGLAPLRDEPALAATPAAVCDGASRASSAMQGRVPPDAPREGYTCNLSVVGHEGGSGGFKVERYTDRAGRTCAYYDTTLQYPANMLITATTGIPTGTAVLDMTDSRHPVRTTTLQSPAMQSPHESLLVNTRRGLLAAVLASAGAAPGVLDLYDISEDCRYPVLRSVFPLAGVGHESGFAPDGLTFYSTSPRVQQLLAIDVSDPAAPAILALGRVGAHGTSISRDGRRAYVAASNDGLVIVDTSQVQDRRANPKLPVVGELTWRTMTTPQGTLPVTIAGRPYVVEVDEFAHDRPGGNASANGPVVGAARIIDISDERSPRVVSNLRLAVNQPENRAALAADAGAQLPVQGYSAHYCNVPREEDPGIVACSFIASGLRIFDIREPQHPREVGYFVAPLSGLFGTPGGTLASNFAMSRPTFDLERHEVWYSDANGGFYALSLRGAAWPFDARGHTLPLRPPCTSRRAFTIHLPRGLRSARVTVDGRSVRVRRGRRLTARIDLRRTGRALVTVRITGRTVTGRLVRATRRYRPCQRRA